MPTKNRKAKSKKKEPGILGNGWKGGSAHNAISAVVKCQAKQTRKQAGKLARELFKQVTGW